LEGKGKGKGVPVPNKYHAMKTYGGVSGQLHTLATLPLGKEALVPIGLGGWLSPRTSPDVVARRKESHHCPQMSSL